MDKDAIIEKQAAEIKMLKEYIKVLEQKIQLLEEEIARLKKNSGNSSKPPSSDIVKPRRVLCKVSRKKRKRGGQFGHKKFSRQPFESEQVDEVIEYEFKDKDSEGLKPLDEWFIIQQIELPEKMYKVIEHRGRKYLDLATGNIHIAPMPDEIRKGGLLGADVTAMAAFMKGSCHMSYTTIQQFFKELLKLDISRGVLCKATQKASKALKPSYNQLTNVCRMSRRLMLMKPAIMTMASCTGRGVLIHLITVCLKLINLVAVKYLKTCCEKTLPVLSAPTTGAHTANMPVCLMFGCSTVWLT